MESQQSIIRIAKLAGFLYVLQMATSMFAEIAIFGTLRVKGDAVATVRNIAENETLFRTGIATMFFTSLIVVVLIWALYVILKQVDQNLVFLGVFWRLTETAIVCLAPVNQLISLRLISGAEYLQPVNPEYLNAMSNLFLNTYGSTLYLGFICTGLGSIVFAYLFYRSGYIPKSLSILGMVGSAILALGAFAVLIFPPFGKLYYPFGMILMFFWEVGAGIWMWKNGIRLTKLAADKENSIGVT
jgi:hypothetical protein